MKKQIANEAKTGLLVIVSLLVLGGLAVKVGNINLFSKGYTVKSRFHFTAGVKKHAPVRLSGVDVGEVKDAKVMYGDETLVELTLWLNEGTHLNRDAKAYVTTLGMMGEKYIEIKAGSAAAGEAKEGDLILGQDPVRLEELIEIGTKVAGDISHMAGDISSVAKHVDQAVVDNRPKIDVIFDNLEDTSENFRDFSEDIKYHPWKILAKGKEKSKEEMLKERQARHAASKKNFSIAAAAKSG